MDNILMANDTIQIANDTILKLEELKKIREIKLLEKQRLEDGILEYERKNKILFFNNPEKGYLGTYGKWESNPHQAKCFKAFENPITKIIALTGGNRLGKSFFAKCIELSMYYGRWPWEDESKNGWLWELRGWKPPIKIRYIGQDWEKHIKSVVIPIFKELNPESWGITSKKNSVGVEAYWTNRDKTVETEIMSNNSESSVFEGNKAHIILYDEPPKRDNRIASIRGLIDYNGIEVYAMTLLKEAWIDKEVINAVDDDGNFDKTVFSVVAESYDNVGYGINKAGLDQFAKSLTEEEKLARLKGIPAYKSGIILNINRNVNIIDRPVDRPLNWLWDIAIDVHPSKPQYILFIATDERNFKYFGMEIIGHGDGKWIGEQIIKKILKYNLRVNRIIIDPLAKADKNNENSVYGNVEKVLWAYGYRLETACKDKDDGIIALNSMLSTRNGIPQLFIFRDMRVTIKQLINWSYDDNGKPSKEDDDMCENAYRLALLNTQYYDESDIDDEENVTYIGRNKHTGY